MAARKKSKKNMLTLFVSWARTISNYAIFIFFICYCSGAFKLRTVFNVPQGWDYIFTPFVVSLVVTGLVLWRARNVSVFKMFYKIPLVIIASFLAGIVEYYILMNPKYDWIILVLSVIALLLTFSVFSLKIKAVWYSEPISRKDTLFHFVKLYALSIFSFSFLYTMLENITTSFNHFDIANPTIPLFDFLYFSIVTVSTLGYGDILPVSLTAKIFVMIQTVMGYLFLSILLGLMINWLGMKNRRTD